MKVSSVAVTKSLVTDNGRELTPDERSGLRAQAERYVANAARHARGAGPA